MSKFNKIKKYNKNSLSINEKIKFLDKEMEKTGLNEVAANSTAAVYVSTPTTPNSGYAEITGKNFNGKGFAMSGDTNLGQGSFGGATIRPSDGAALSPPHPVTGERRTTQTKASFGFKLAIPGEKPTPDSRMTGPIMWYWNPSGGAGSGSWESLEYNSAGVHGNQPFPFGGDNAGWGYWGSGAFGFPLLRSDGDAFASLFNTIGEFDPKDSVPETVVLTKDKIDDPNFLPIDTAKKFIAGLLGLAKEGLEFLGELALKEPQDFINAAISGLFSPNPDRNYAPDLAGSIADGKPRVYPDEKIPKDQKDKFIDNLDWNDIGNNISINPEPTNYSDDNFYVNDDGKVVPHTPESKKKYPPNTHAHAGDTPNYNDNPLGNAGEFHLELVVPENGDEPYFNYEDHIYFNPNSKDKGEVPDAIRKFFANISQSTGSTLPDYPDGIHGDVVKKFRIPLRDAIRRNPDISNNINIKKILSSSVSESLNESVKLGHFDPEVLNVDINDIRKGIMPEFPKDPPKMINGYSAKSRLAPKDIKGEPFIKVTKKDLAALHILKDSEIKELLQQIDLINAYLKNNPADLIYAQQRYPKDDIRLAQLNWKMDQMMKASEEYMETHFPENQKLFSKLQDKIIKNINQTDPKNFTGHKEAPKFTDDNVEMSEQRKKTVLKYFKKPVKIKKLFKH